MFWNYLKCIILIRKIIFILKCLPNFNDFINKLQISHPINIPIKGNFLFNLMNEHYAVGIGERKKFPNHDLFFFFLMIFLLLC